MSVCILEKLDKYRVLWTDISASCREINRFSVSKIGPELAKPMNSLALVETPHLNYSGEVVYNIHLGKNDEK